MRDFPRVAIVISSMWRYVETLEQLRSHFSADIQPRIIGTTLLPPRSHDGYLPARREQEIIDWLTANDRLSDPWIALDDVDWQFLAHKSKLIACKPQTGFDATIERLLRDRLEML